MPRSTRARLFTILGFVFVLLGGYLLISSVQPARSASGGSHADVHAFEPYLHYLHEFTERRRANIYFKNEQSIFDGVQINFVNTTRGNLTFVRRDLVTAGRLPLMAARVYDSSGRGSVELGPGWHLTVPEAVEVQGDSARLFSESGAVIEFVRAGGRFVLAKNYPSDYISLDEGNGGRLVATLRTGFAKEFRRIGNSYRLSRVADRNGNEIRFDYVGDALKRIESEAHFIELVRAKNGRVVAVRDELNRKVSYRYDERGLLASMTDLGGNVWSYKYTGDGRLHKAVDPVGRDNFKVWHQPDGRLRELELPSGRIRYIYNNGTRSTTVTGRRGLVTRLFHNEQGITTRVVNALGEETRIVRRNVQELWENGVLAQQMEYDGEHRIVSRRSLRGGKETTVRYVYSADGELARIERSDGTAVELAYDERSNLVGVTDAQGPRSYRYSVAGDLTAVTKLGQAIQFDVDADGLIKGMNESSTAQTTNAVHAGREACGDHVCRWADR